MTRNVSPVCSIRRDTRRPRWSTTRIFVVINTCSVRERAEERLYTELGMVPGGRAGKRPIVAVTGCVAQQEGRALLERGQRVDLVVGTQALEPPAGDGGGVDRGPAGARRRQSLRQRVVPAGGGPAFQPGQGGDHDYRGLQRLLLVLRRAVYAGPRTDAAGRGDRRRSPARRRRGISRGPSSRPDRESLRGSRPARLRLRRAARAGARRAGHSAHPVREPASTPCHRPHDRGHAHAAEGLPAPASPGAVGVHRGGWRGCAGGIRETTICIWSTD